MSIERLQELRARKRIAELRAKRDSSADPTGEGAATLAAEQKYNDEAPSALEAAKLGNIQGVSRNWGDEAIGKLAGMFGGDSDVATHKVRQRDLRSRDEQPAAYYGANVPSAIATSLMPTGVGANIAAASVDGAARSLGESAELNGDAAKDAAVTGGIDGATAGTLAKVAPGLLKMAQEKGEAGMKWLADVLKKQANSQAVKSLGGTKGQVEKLGSKADEIGNMLLENKVVTPLATSKTVADRVAQQGENLSAQTTPIYAAAENSKLKPQSLYYEIEAKIAELKPNPGNAPKIAKLQKYQDDLIESGAESFNPAELRKYRQSVDQTINFNSDAPSQMAAKDMRGILRDKEMGLISDVDPALAKQNEKLFKDIHLNILAEDMAEKGAAKSAVNNEVGMNTWQAGTQAAAAGATGGSSVLAMAAREFLKRYGNQMTAVGMDKVSKAMTNSRFSPLFADAAKRGPSAVAAVHAALLGNSEYRSLVDDRQK